MGGELYEWVKGVVELSDRWNSWIDGLSICLFILKVKQQTPPPIPKITPTPKMTALKSYSGPKNDFTYKIN